MVVTRLTSLALHSSSNKLDASTASGHEFVLTSNQKLIPRDSRHAGSAATDVSLRLSSPGILYKSAGAPSRASFASHLNNLKNIN